MGYLSESEFVDCVVSALQGCSSTVVTRHDCPADKMVRSAIAVARELDVQLGAICGFSGNAGDKDCLVDKE